MKGSCSKNAAVQSEMVKKHSSLWLLNNTDRAFGTILGAEITRNHKKGLPEDTVDNQLYRSRRTKLRRLHPQGTYPEACR